MLKKMPFSRNFEDNLLSLCFLDQNVFGLALRSPIIRVFRPVGISHNQTHTNRVSSYSQIQRRKQVRNVNRQRKKILLVSAFKQIQMVGGVMFGAGRKLFP